MDEQQPSALNFATLINKCGGHQNWNTSYSSSSPKATDEARPLIPGKKFCREFLKIFLKNKITCWFIIPVI